MRKAAIVGAQRIPFTRSFREYNRLSNQQLLTPCLQALVQKFGLQGERLGDVALGALLNRSTEWNFARECTLGSGLDPRTPAYNLQRACGTSLDAALQIALRIGAGQIETGIAGGSDTNSDLPLQLQQKLSWKLTALRAAKSIGEKMKILFSIRFSELSPVYPSIVEPRTGLSMGQHTERMVKEWGVTRAEQDELALASHRNAEKAWREGFYDDLAFPFMGVEKDTIVRGDTSLEKLAALKPAFDKSSAGTLTAGNSTVYTDGAAALLLASEDYAASRGWAVMAWLRDAESAAVDYVHGEGLLMAPTWAVGRLLRRNGLRLQDFDFYEIHEAFAGQVLCNLRAWEDEGYCRKMGLSGALGPIDRAKLNVKGGSVAIGHPFAATGARILGQTAKLLHRHGGGRALVSICTAGGMGITAIVEK